jgi:phosphoglycolate phosphatase
VTDPVLLFVFDLDGTLVDSRRDIAESANATLEECGAAHLSEDAIAGMVGDGAAALVARAFAAVGATAPSDALDRFLRIYNSRLLRFTRPYDGTLELLEALATRSVLAVLTNKPLGATHAILDGLGLSRCFGERVRGGDGPLPRKPDARGLQELMALVGVQPARTLMVGDSLVDVQTAHNAAARACLVRYGFGHDRVPPEALQTRDVVIDRPLDLLDAV